MQSIEVELKQAIQNAVKKAFDLDLDVQNIVVETPKNKDHGDFSSNVAMQLTRQLHQNPRMIAQSILDAFSLEMVSNVEIAGPGFLNFTLSKDRFSTVISEVLAQKENYGQQPANGIKVDLEYVSANPTGSLHLGHARGAAWGDSCARIMKKAGYDVTREYYVNDAGNQITNLALSLNARYRQAQGIPTEIGQDGYMGKDVEEKGYELAKEYPQTYLEPTEENLKFFRKEGIKFELDKIRKIFNNVIVVKNEENVLGYAMNYYYIEKANFKNNTYIDISSENNLNYVIIGRKNVVGLKSNNYSEIKRGSLRKDSLEIETQKYFEDYDQIIIAIINPNKPSLRYNINCMREKFFKLVSADDMTNREKREEIYQKNDYIEIKIKDIKELLNSIINIGEAGIQDGDNESVRSQISNAMEELNNENIQLDKFNTVRIYELDLGKISLTEDVNDRIKKMYSGLTFKVFDKTNPQGLRICVGVNIGALSKNKFNFYLVFTDDAENANAYLVEILEN